MVRRLLTSSAKQERNVLKAPPVRTDSAKRIIPEMESSNSGPLNVYKYTLAVLWISHRMCNASPGLPLAWANNRSQSMLAEGTA